jgi:hypothetical protein
MKKIVQWSFQVAQSIYHRIYSRVENLVRQPIWIIRIALVEQVAVLFDKAILESLSTVRGKHQKEERMKVG